MTGSQENPTISIVIPTYGREQVLLNTLASLLNLQSTASEIVLVDQTPVHEQHVNQQLEKWANQGKIHWLRGSKPSIPTSMNLGVSKAGGKYLLFLDDDIVPDSHLLDAHLAAHRANCGDLIAGRVLQPWHGDAHDSHPFTRGAGEFKQEFMGGNFSISRRLLLELGGFDENFKGAAYNFEREFSDRFLASGHTIWYEPSALIRHLHHSTGGTRSKGTHLTSWNPRHPVGAYYYLLISPSVQWRLVKVAKRFFSSVITRHHLKSPWFIPVTWVSELSGLLWALGLRLRGPALPFMTDERAIASK